MFMFYGMILYDFQFKGIVKGKEEVIYIYSKQNEYYATLEVLNQIDKGSEYKLISKFQSAYRGLTY